MIMRKNIWPAAGFSAIALAAGGLSGFISSSAMKNYETLLQPPLAPPGWVFPAMWTVLYILMGVSAGIVWRRGHGRARSQALWLWGVQLFFNFCWTFIFFNLQWRLFAFFWLLVLLALVTAMISRFSRISSAAANLNLPYALWLCFAGYLNIGVYLLNG
jgi:benzodiazapine receptor